MGNLPRTFSLGGRRILVIFVSGCIDKSMADGMAERGARSLVNVRNSAYVAKLAAEPGRNGLDEIHATFDIKVADATRHWFDGLAAQPLNWLVNDACAGDVFSIRRALANDCQEC